MRTYDLTQQPPTEAELAAERQRQATELARLTRRKTVILSIGVGAVAGVGAATVAGAAAGTVAGVMAVASFVLGIRIIPLETTTDSHPGQEALAALAPITPEHCPAVVAWCREDSTVAAYQAAVATQGRLLVEWEYAAMRKWVEDRAARLAQKQRDAEQTAAIELLRQPVMNAAADRTPQ